MKYRTLVASRWPVGRLGQRASPGVDIEQVPAAKHEGLAEGCANRYDPVLRVSVVAQGVGVANIGSSKKVFEVVEHDGLNRRQREAVLAPKMTYHTAICEIPGEMKANQRLPNLSQK